MSRRSDGRRKRSCRPANACGQTPPALRIAGDYGDMMHIAEYRCAQPIHGAARFSMD
jgi:hypothetical protein